MGTHPRERVRTLMVTTPPNTPDTAPQSTTWDIGRGVLDRLHIIIPTGHVGLTGIQLLWGARQVAPYEAAEWIMGDGHEMPIALGLWIGAGVVTVRTYNTDDTYPHSHHIHAYMVDLDLPDHLVLPAPPVFLGELPPSPEPFPEEPGLPGEEVPEGLSAEEAFVVATVFDQFLSDLAAILDGFLSSLQTTLSGTVPEVGEEPPPEEAEPAPATGGQDGEDHHHHKHGSGPHKATVSHKRSTAHAGHHHFVKGDAPKSAHHLHRHTHADGTTH